MPDTGRDDDVRIAGGGVIVTRRRITFDAHLWAHPAKRHELIAHGIPPFGPHAQRPVLPTPLLHQLRALDNILGAISEP